MVGAVQEGTFKRCVHGCKWCLYERECCGSWGGPLVLRESLLGGDVYGVCHCQLLWLCLRDFFRAPVHRHVVGNVQVVLCAVKPQGFAALLCTCAMQLHQLRLSFTCLLYVTNQPG